MVCIPHGRSDGIQEGHTYRDEEQRSASHHGQYGGINFLRVFRIFVYKAEEAGKRVIKVNPAYTSQICSNCGTMVKKELSVRLHSCPSCKIELDRDVNAAINILSFGTKLLNT